MRRILLGAALTIVTAMIIGLVVFRLGLIAVSADGTHSKLEGRVMPVILHAAVAREAAGERSSTSITDESRQTAKRNYLAMCSTCHGSLNGKPSDYGQSFYPPAPGLSRQVNEYKDSELFWIIKHGIRNTGMPSWSGSLSDEEIWQIALMLKSPDQK